VENPEEVDDALSKAYAETGRIDYVVNTAGVLRIGRLAETDNATIEEALKVNYLAPVQIARSSYKYLGRPRASCCCTPPAATPGAAPSTASTPPPRPPW